jgi:casein kinase II subunit alpha
MPPALLAKLQGHPAKGWAGYMKDAAVPEDALDLLSKMVVIDHSERFTATEALAHPYFDPIRAVAESQ